MKPTLRFVELKAISGSSWMPPNVPSSVTRYPTKCKINFDITQVIGLTNDDANYDLAIWVTYYNFLRPHEQAGYKVLNKVGKLEGASSKPDKWQLLIFL